MDRRIAEWLSVACCIASLGGCVERRFVITTDPPGAIVYDEKTQPIGASPADRQFVYYGKYRFTLVRDGYETMIVEEAVRAPWFEFLGLDFISENVIPWPIRDVRRFHYVLQPKQLVSAKDVKEEADKLRLRGQAIGTTQKLPAEPVPVEGPTPRTLPPGAAPPVEGPTPRTLPPGSPPPGAVPPVTPGTVAPLPPANPPPGAMPPPVTPAPTAPPPGTPPADPSSF